VVGGGGARGWTKLGEGVVGGGEGGRRKQRKEWRGRHADEGRDTRGGGKREGQGCVGRGESKRVGE